MRLLYGPIVAVVFASFVCPALGQDLENRIPSNQSPISKVFAPSASEQTKPGTGKFVLFTQEQMGKERYRTIGAWECIPSRPEVPIIKRIDFGRSSRYARPLIGLFCNAPRGIHPNLLLLQRDYKDADFNVDLYDIDYRTWKARCIWQGHRLEAYGIAGESLFCRSGEDWLTLDIPLKTINKKVPFTPLFIYGDRWLVKKPGDETGAWS